ncbi:MAG: hypothetical protein LBH26_05205 [Treponema sp.]|nr:hypothetical protein [Treponema sp.]
MKKRVFICAVLCFIGVNTAFPVEEVSRETIPIDWDEGKFDMYRYTDAFMREHGYYAIDYAIKENATSSIWNTQIITIKYRNPDYWVVHEVHNYFMISYYFSDTQITNNRSQSEYTISPYEKEGGDWLLYVRKHNSLVSKISLLIRDLKAVNTAKREKDTAYLEAASRVLY